MTRPGRTRYQPIADHLATVAEAEIPLTLEEIAAMIGAPLPVSAFVSPDFWTAAKSAHVHAWERIGWRARLDIRNRRVLFTRVEG